MTTAVFPTIQSYRFEGTMTARSSITHFGDSSGGIEQVLRREKVSQPNGSVVEVPIISGNSWRGQLRDCGMKAMLDEIGAALGVEHARVTLAPYYLLFSGGVLSKEAGRGIDIGMQRRLRALIPLLSVLGGATGRQMPEGKLVVEKIVPVCAETVEILLPYLAGDPGDPQADPPREPISPHAHTTFSIYERLQLEHYTRMDDAKRLTLTERYLDTADQQQLLDAPQVRTVKNKKTDTEEEVAKEPGAAQQMRYGFESYSAGTVFQCAVQLNSVTDLEFQSFMFALREWSKNPVIGGKAAIGHGRVKLEWPGWQVLEPRLRPEDATAVGASFGNEYRAHLAAHGQEILQTLETLL